MAAELSSSASRRRYSEYNITVNTNHKPITAQTKLVLMNRLKNFFETHIHAPALMSQMFVFSPSINVVDHVLLTPGVEIGPKNGFVHGHAVLLIEHHGEVRLKKQGAQAALQKAVIDYIGTRGAYAYIELANASLLNYVSKTSGDKKEIESTGIRDAISF
jgi:hypothetical protein